MSKWDHKYTCFICLGSCYINEVMRVDYDMGTDPVTGKNLYSLCHECRSWLSDKTNMHVIRTFKDCTVCRARILKVVEDGHDSWWHCEDACTCGNEEEQQAREREREPQPCEYCNPLTAIVLPIREEEANGEA